MEMSKSYKRPLVSAPEKSSKGSKDLQNDMAYSSWNVSSRPMAVGNSFQNRSSGSRPPPLPAPAKPKAFKELHMTPVTTKGPSVTTKRRSAPNVQPWKQQVLSEEYIQEGDKTSKLIRKKIPKSSSSSSHKVAIRPESGDSDGKPRSSGSDEERERVMYARRGLEQALNKADSLVDELEKLEDDIEILEEEKMALLDQLLVCEGLAVNPYPRFRRRSFNRIKQKVSET